MECCSTTLLAKNRHEVIPCLRERSRTLSQELRPLPIAVIFLVLFCPLPSTAQENANRLEPLDVFSVQVAADPRISPDGKRIVYVRQSAAVASDRRVSNLWIVNFDGSEHRPLTSGSYSDS